MSIDPIQISGPWILAPCFVLDHKKHVSCLATLLQNELNSDVARFTTQIKPVLQQIRLLTGFGKKLNIVLQLILQDIVKQVVFIPKLHIMSTSPHKTRG